MDRMLYLSMTAAKNTLQAQSINSHNLANASTSGFREDLSQFRSMPVLGPGHASRVYALSERPGVNLNTGSIQYTDNELDIAIDGDGWMAIMVADGTEAYTRAGDLRISANGLLENGAGYAVLGNAGPISIPPAEKVEVGSDGTISIRPVGQDERTLATVDRIKLVNPPREQLYKGLDGQIRIKDGSNLPPDASVRIFSGALESSNVNTVEALVDMISLARQFEMNIKAMQTVQENDEAASRILQMR